MKLAATAYRGKRKVWMSCIEIRTNPDIGRWLGYRREFAVCFTNDLATMAEHTITKATLGSTLSAPFSPSLLKFYVLCQHPACFSIRGRDVVIVVRLIGFQQRHSGAFLYRFNCLVFV